MSPAGPALRAAGGEVLVVEHESAVAELARRYLVKAGLQVRCAGTAEGAAAALAALDALPGAAAVAGRPAGAVVLDLTMPGLDARWIRRLIRTQPAGRRRAGSPPVLAGTGVPVICLTAGEGAQAALTLRARDIGVGQDACLTRPFSPRALVAKVLTAIRTAAAAVPASTPPAAAVTTPAGAASAPGGAPAPGAASASGAAPPPGVTSASGGLYLDPERRLVRLGGVPVALTATEFDLLACLVREAGRTCSRERLRREIWPPGAGPASRNVDVYIAQLRAKLGPGIGIRTVRGVGYVLDREPGGGQAARTPPATIVDAGHPSRGDSGTAWEC